MDRQHRCTIRRLPPELVTEAFAFIAHPAPEYRRADAEPLEDLRQLGDVAESIRHVTLPHTAAQSLSRARADQQIADQRFGAHQVFIGQGIPRADHQPAAAHQALQVAAAFRTYRQVVLDRQHLAVEHEAPIRRIAVQQLDQPVDQPHQPDAKHLKGRVPGTIPVGVGDEGSGELLVSHDLSNSFSRVNR